MIKTSVVLGDICEQDVDAIVNPANSYGLMGGGVAASIRRAGGIEIQEQAVSNAPIPIGKAIVTTAGKLKAKAVIHAPTMKNPSEDAAEEHVEKAVIAALTCADQNGFEKIAMPGMGTGVGGLSYNIAAEIMINAIYNFKAKHLKEVVLVGITTDIVDAFKAVKIEKF